MNSSFITHPREPTKTSHPPTKQFPHPHFPQHTSNLQKNDMSIINIPLSHPPTHNAILSLPHSSTPSPSPKPFPENISSLLSPPSSIHTPNSKTKQRQPTTTPKKVTITQTNPQWAAYPRAPRANPLPFFLMLLRPTCSTRTPTTRTT